MGKGFLKPDKKALESFKLPKFTTHPTPVNVSVRPLVQGGKKRAGSGVGGGGRPPPPLRPGRPPRGGGGVGGGGGGRGQSDAIGHRGFASVQLMYDKLIGGGLEIEKFWNH